MDLMLQRPKYADPLYHATILPAMEWVIRINVAAYNNNEKTLQKHANAWYNAIAWLYTVSQEMDPWTKVNGPAAACILSLLRVK